MMNKKSFFSLMVCISFTMLLKPLYAEPYNLGLLKKQIREYHDSGAYHDEIKHVLTHAEQFITQRVRQNNKRVHPEKLAVVFDIDETVISNYEKLISQKDFGATRDEWHREILLARSPAIKPALALYHQLLKQHVAVFFITGRPVRERDATIKELKRAGFKHWNALFLKPSYDVNTSNAPYKRERRARITHAGYTIIASIGDQQSDLNGGYAERKFKLPNPFYYLP
jgi:predicted secreted acid phosphatase